MDVGAEGTRSKDGRLGEFKRGPFTMAKQAGVTVVPVTITGVAKAMPPFALAPLHKVRWTDLSADGRKRSSVSWVSVVLCVHGVTGCCSILGFNTLQVMEIRLSSGQSENVILGPWF